MHPLHPIGHTMGLSPPSGLCEVQEHRDEKRGIGHHSNTTPTPLTEKFTPLADKFAPLTPLEV